MDPITKSSSGPRLTALGKIFIFLFIVACIGGAYYMFTCQKGLEDAKNKAGSLLGTGGPPVEIGIAYGTEKQRWLEWAVAEFEKTSDGKRIKVNLIPMGSLEGAHALVSGDQRINVWSPASALYKDIFVQDWQVKYNDNPIIKEEPLSLSPMVFVMSAERYQAFSQKYKTMSLHTMNQALQEKSGWDGIGHHHECVPVKFRHRQADQADSGLMKLRMPAHDF